MKQSIRSLALIVASLPATSAFPAFATRNINVARLATKNSKDMDPVNIDIERAKDCAENFGKCSTEEMEELRDGLHKERLHTMIFGGANVAPEEAFQHHILEEELSLQLSLLNEATPPPTMFPDTTEVEAEHTVVHPTVGEKILMVEEAIVEENLGDALAICVVLAAMVAAPQLLQM